MLVNKVFVYGSLRSDMFNYKKLLDGKVKNVKKGSILGSLFHIENKGYPAVISGENLIKGELMEINDFENNLISLDKLERYFMNNIDESEYIRKIVDVKLSSGSFDKAYYYEYNKKSSLNTDDDLIFINSGDWKEYIESK